MGGHGVLGVSAKGWASVGAFIGFFYYLSDSFKGPEEPKYLVEPWIAQMAKETQPGIVPEYYYKPKKISK